MFAHLAIGRGSHRSEAARPSSGQIGTVHEFSSASSSPHDTIEALPGNLQGSHNFQFATDVVSVASAQGLRESESTGCNSKEQQEEQTQQPSAAPFPPCWPAPAPVPPLPTLPPCTEQAMEVEAGPAARVKRSEKPTLALPLPKRRALAAPCSPARDEAMPAELPKPSTFVSQGCSGTGGRRAARASRQLPARLQALDDRTVVPRDVYDRMLRLGDAARGSLGYGQHIKMFDGPDGVPVLRRAA